MVEFYIDIRVVLILVFAHGPPTLLALTGQGIELFYGILPLSIAKI
jgi:hypothetical protein